MEKDLTLKQVELDKMIIELREDGIMQFEAKPADELLVSDLKEINSAANELGDNKTFPRLVIANSFIKIDEEIRSYAASEESNKNTLAAAFVVKPLALKLVGNFYILFNKPVRPTRLFSSEQEAVKWLKTFL